MRRYIDRQKGLEQIMTGLDIFSIIVWGGLVVYAIYWLYRFIERKNAATVLTPEEFRKDMRKVQIVDVRERPEFEAGHILGARSIAFTQFKERYLEIRKDQPVYLYDQRTALSGRAAALLKKNGYDKDRIFILKGGFDNWDGKIKKGN